MIEIVKITPSTIELKGVRFSDGQTVEKIMNICHKFKHLYLEGFPCGCKTRKNSKKKMKKWADCPGVCFTYWVTNDSENHNFTINILVSDIKNLLEKYTEREIEHFKQNYTQDVADAIASI